RRLRRYRRLQARNRRAGLEDPYEADRASMLRLDPPDHTRLRNLVSKAFTPRAVAAMRPVVEKYVDELLGALEGRRTIELIRDFAAPLPVSVIAEMLGVPVEDRERFRHWSDEAVRTLGDGTMDDRRRGGGAREERGAYLEAIAEERRREPRGDLLSGLVAAEEAGDHLSTTELFTTCVLPPLAGEGAPHHTMGHAS